MEALFRAYFTEGRDISHRQTIIEFVDEVGMKRHLAETLLNGDDRMDLMANPVELSRRHRVQSVPFDYHQSSIKRSPSTVLSSQRRFWAFRQASLRHSRTS